MDILLSIERILSTYFFLKQFKAFVNNKLIIILLFFSLFTVTCVRSFEIFIFIRNLKTFSLFLIYIYIC